MRARCDEPPPRQLLEGIKQFNDGEYFEQHETLELLWRGTRTPDRGLYHGILQIGVGLHHWKQGNYHGASVLIEEGIERLRPFSPACHTVDVARLIADAVVIREKLASLGAARIGTVDVETIAPRIVFVR